MGGDRVIGAWHKSGFRLSAQCRVVRGGDTVFLVREESAAAVAKLKSPNDEVALLAVHAGWERGHVALTSAELKVLQEACAGTVYLTAASVQTAVGKLSDALVDINAGSVAGQVIAAVRDWLESELP